MPRLVATWLLPVICKSLHITGKSFITTAIGHQACIYGFKTIYFNFGKLIPVLKLKKADGSYINEIRRIFKKSINY
ncbi:MAG: ATP-binding protein, partial [Cyanobacteria bacterium]|nr:ATP-binding protein [Cyanobacteriota bacterium]